MYFIWGKLWGRAIVVKLCDCGAMIYVPSLMEIYQRKASYVYKPYVSKLLRNSQNEFGLENSLE